MSTGTLTLIKSVVISGIGGTSMYYGRSMYCANKNYDTTTFAHTSSFVQGAYIGAFTGAIVIILSPILIPVSLTEFIFNSKRQSHL